MALAVDFREGGSAGSNEPLPEAGTNDVVDGCGGCNSWHLDLDSLRSRAVLLREGFLSQAVHNPSHFIVRASWLFGVHGRNFVDTMLGLADHQDEVVVVRDQVGCPTYTGHLAHGLIRLLDGDPRAYGVHHMAGSGQCSWYEFAVEIFRQADVQCQVLSATSDMLDRPAPRPAYSVLVSEREHPIVLPDWEDGLSAFLAERAEAHA